jgi:RNA polymerase sigma factor (sigma-70 family)
MIELVHRAKNGDQEAFALLWERVKRLAAWKANHVILSMGDNPPVEIDDLINSGYIAMCEAVRRYAPPDDETPEQAGFLKLFTFCLQTEFANYTGYRTEKQKQDPLRYADRLERPIKGDEDLSVGDMVADPIDPIEAVEDRIFQKQLRDALERALNKLDETEQRAVRMKYYEDLSYDEISNRLGTQKAQKLCDDGLKHLRRPIIRKDLEQFVDLRTNFYYRVSSKSHESPVELLAMRRETMREDHGG